MRFNSCVLPLVAVILTSAVSAQAGYVDAVLADSPFEYFRMQETNVGHTSVAANSGTTGIGGSYYLNAGQFGSFTDVASMTLEVTPGKDIAAGGCIGVSPQGSTYGSLSAFTVEFLFKSGGYDGTGLNPISCVQGQGSANDVALTLGDSTLRMTVGTNTVTPGVDIGTAAPVGEWAHVAVTYDATGADSVTKFYVNGSLLNPGGSLCGGKSVGNWNAYTLIAAYMPSDTPYYFTGALDEYAVYNRVLSDSDIAYHASLVPAASVPGDANRDGKVDGSDVTILAGNWQVLSGATWAMGDFNADGKVDGSDVTILAGNWQTGVNINATAVPEPATCVLLVTGLMGLLTCTWRKRK